MSDQPKFPHIDRWTAKHPINLFREVIATEKVDGSNFRCGIAGGAFWVGGRNVVFSEGQDPFGAATWARENDVEAKMRAGMWHPDAPTTLFGEIFGPGIQKRIDYGQERRVAFFDVMVGDTFLDPGAVEAQLAAMGLPAVPTLYAGAPDPDAFAGMAAAITTIGNREKDNNFAEGIVLRPAVRLRDKRGEWIVAKYKNPAFDEMKPTPKPEQGRIEDADAAAVLAYVTDERLTHVLTYLREEGREVDIRLTGEVIKRMVADVLREGEFTEEQRNAVGKLVPGEAKRLFLARLEVAA